VKVAAISVFECSAPLAWEELQKSALLLRVAAPWLGIRCRGPQRLPQRWSEGSSYLLQLSLFNLVPLGAHTVYFESIDRDRLEIQTRESGPFVSQWDHRITIRSVPQSGCLYIDEVEIKAGWLTPVVAFLAQRFFRHRHKRWAAVARQLRFEQRRGTVVALPHFTKGVLS
jgi:hypothetical protein